MENPLEKNAFIDPTRKESYVTTRLTDSSFITSLKIFEILTFWNKLEFLKHTTNKDLLQQVVEATTSKQLRASALYRLYQLNEI